MQTLISKLYLNKLNQLADLFAKNHSQTFTKTRFSN